MMEILNATAKRLLRTMGEFVDKYESLNKFLFAHHVANIFRKYSIHCVIDVGANRGGFRDFLRNQVGYSGLILSFEPVRANVEVLQRLAKRDRNWVVFDFALGNADNSLQMNVMNRHEFSSFLMPDHSSVKQFLTRNKIEHTETVQIRKLDSVMHEIRLKGHQGNMYLKVDTQGYDLEVLRGAVENLPTFHAVQTELSFQAIYANMPGFQQVLDFLLGKGFQVCAISPVTHDSMLRVVESDCVLINSRFAGPGPPSATTPHSQTY